MSNFNLCIFEPPQSISNHFLGAPAFYSHYYYYYYFLLFFWISSEHIYIYIYILFSYFFSAGTQKWVTTKTMKILLYMNYIATVISNRSNGYIHLYWTGPPTFSNGKCMGKCSIESKNDGGNIISSLHIFSTIFVSSLSMWSTFNLLEHISCCMSPARHPMVFFFVCFACFGSRHLVFGWRLLGNPDIMVLSKIWG